MKDSEMQKLIAQFRETASTEDQNTAAGICVIECLVRLKKFKKHPLTTNAIRIHWQAGHSNPAAAYALATLQAIELLAEVGEHLAAAILAHHLLAFETALDEEPSHD